MISCFSGSDRIGSETLTILTQIFSSSDSIVADNVALRLVVPWALLDGHEVERVLISIDSQGVWRFGVTKFDQCYKNRGVVENECSTQIIPVSQ